PASSAACRSVEYETRRMSKKMVTVTILLVVAACVLPFVLTNYRTFQATLVLVYAIALLGLNILTGYNGQISLGHGAFYAIGAYAAAVLMDQAGMPYWATIPLAGAVCLVVGFLFGLPALRVEGLSLALGVSAMYTGIAGALGAIAVQFVAPDSFTVFLSITFLVGSVVGGLASLSGALYGALFIQFVPNIADELSKAAPWAVFGVFLIGFVYLMPTGVAGALRALTRRRGGGKLLHPKEALP